MSECDLYVQSIPTIAEIIVECRKMSKTEFEKWKQVAIQSAPDNVKEFIEKVIIVIDMYVGKSIRSKCKNG